jgi:WD40 repeat protein
MDANDLVRPIHDRMPVIIDPPHFGRWVDPAEQDAGALAPLLRPFAAERVRAYCASFSPQGDLWAVACDDGKVRLWDAHAGAREPQRTLECGGPACALAWSHDGANLAVAVPLLHAVEVWNMQGDQTMKDLKADGVDSLAFSPDGAYLAAAGGQAEADGRAYLWDTGNWKERSIPVGTSPARCVAFSADGKTLAVACGDAVALVDVSSAGERSRVRPQGMFEVLSVAYSRDGTKMAVAGFAGHAAAIKVTSP